ncbi:MAG: SMC-Scp complex subunit ScpB [Thermoplasmata archaeon]|nr:SMC-Scp complex subunit ScpB [Thermoplasmata archaeon]
MEKQLSLVIEALLFSSGREMSVREIAQMLGLEEKDVRKGCRELVQRYRKANTAIEIGRVGTRFVMRLRPEFVGVAVPVAMPELEKDEIKTLALIAFYQPLKQSVLSKMVGSKVYEHIEKLKRMELIKTKKSGATFTLTTTRKFLVYFGIPSAKKEEIRKWVASKVGIELKQEDVPPPGAQGAAENLENSGESKTEQTLE